MTESDSSKSSGESTAKHDLSRLRIDRTARANSARWPLVVLFLLLGSYIAWKELPSVVQNQDPEVVTARVQRRGGASNRTGVASIGRPVARLEITPYAVCCIGTQAPHAVHGAARQNRGHEHRQDSTRSLSGADP